MLRVRDSVRRRFDARLAILGGQYVSVVRQQQPTAVRVRAVLLAAASVIFGIVMLVVLITSTPAGDVSVRQSDGLESFGRVDNRVSDIASNGPILVPDTSQSGRDLYVQHLGDDRLTGWHVFQIRRPVAARECIVEWVPDREVFVDRCNGEEFPADGAGLPVIQWQIDDKDDDDPANDELILDLRSEETRRRDDATTTTTTSSTIPITGR